MAVVNEVSKMIEDYMAQEEILDMFADFRDNITDGDAPSAAILTLATIIQKHQHQQQPHKLDPSAEQYQPASRAVPPSVAGVIKEVDPSSGR